MYGADQQLGNNIHALTFKQDIRSIEFMYISFTVLFICTSDTIKPAKTKFKMPTEMSSWADEIDETDTSLILPPPSEKWVGNQKITTEYSHNDEGKKVRNFHKE